MMRLIRPFLLIILAYKTFCSYSSSSLISTCISTESSGTYKWCRYYPTISSGYSCSNSETSFVCGGSSSYRCSSDTSKLPQNAKKLLCLTDYFNCNSQTSSLSEGGSSSLNSNYFGTCTHCWYRFTPTSSTTTSVNININSSNNANVEVYYESTYDSYEYKGSLSSGGSMDVSISNYYAVWVLAIPNSSSAYISVTATANGSSSSSSSSSSSDSVDTVLIVTIIIPPVVCCLCCICISVCLAVGIAMKAKQMSQLYNNPAARAQPSTPQPQNEFENQQHYGQSYLNNV